MRSRAPEAPFRWGLAAGRLARPATAALIREVSAQFPRPELYLFVVFNAALAVFNLLPIPPLDGSSLLFRFLSPMTAARVRPLLAQFGFIGLLLFILVGGHYLGALIYGVTDVLVGL